MTTAGLQRRRAIRPDVAAASCLLIVYALTLAHGVTYWDAGEFLAAVHSLGVPHPPGTPLYVLLARVWSIATSPLLGFTMAVNAFSAVCTAAAFGIVANIFWRATRDSIASFAAALTAGLMSTAWLNATETEVYACALLASFVILWCAQRYSLTLERRWVILTIYVCGLAWSLHLTALLTVPAALCVFWLARKRPPMSAIVAGLCLSLLGASVVLFMLLRAQHDPAINQGNPSTLAALIDVIQRRQYDVAPLWPRRAPLWLQFGNVFEYADWQIALGLGPNPEPTLARTSFTIVFALLGVFGCLRHRVMDRASWRAWVTLFVTTSVGVVLYLNLRAGASYGAPVLPPGALHEARDRDYFFTWAFVCWGAWAGFGAIQIARWAGGRSAMKRSSAVAALAGGVVLAALPGALNWTAVRHQRHDEQRRTQRESMSMLTRLPSRAVLLANGDNDTYPLWYLQEVLRIRRDVTVVTIPLLGPRWYRAELRRRYGLLDSATVANWYGTNATTAAVTANAGRAGRPVVPSNFLQMADSAFRH